MTGILRRITSTHNNLRTDTVALEFLHLPEEGKRFSGVGEAVVGDGFRYVETTPIRSFDRAGNVIRFSTENSTYTLTLDEEK